MKYKDCDKNELKFNGEQLTEDYLEKSIQHFVDNCNECIEGAKKGDFKVNDLESFIKWKEDSRDLYLNKEFNINLTFLQHAYYLQTGRSIALLP